MSLKHTSHCRSFNQQIISQSRLQPRNFCVRAQETDGESVVNISGCCHNLSQGVLKRSRSVSRWLRLRRRRNWCLYLGIPQLLQLLRLLYLTCTTVVLHNTLQHILSLSQCNLQHIRQCFIVQFLDPKGVPNNYKHCSLTLSDYRKPKAVLINSRW